ncbi:MAG TPA: PAS domain S-box protein [Pseudobdellovibrionaceae bacterium]|nr:PAS domain S-box protein [Pseudobdellovibrionaceae bacterium]
MPIATSLIAQTRNTFFWVTDEHGVCRFANEAYAKLFGLDSKLVLSKRLDEIFPKEYAEEYQRNNLKVIREGIYLQTYEMGPSLRGGAEAHYLVNKFPVQIGDEVCCGGFAVDVEELYSESESRLRELNKLSQVAERTTNAVILTDPEVRIEWVNQGFTRITEYTLDEVKGRKPFELLHGPETDAEEVRRIRAGLERGEGFNATLVNYSKSGRKFWMQIEARPYFDQRGKVLGFVAIEQDVTERVSLTEQLIHTERLASLGTLAAGVAHEINNPLAVLRNDLELLKGRCDLDLTRSFVAIERIATIVKGLREYARVESKTDEMFSPSEVVCSTLQFLASLLEKQGIEVRTSLSAQGLVQGHSSRFQQVITNIIINARDALMSTTATSADSPSPVIEVAVTTADDGREFEVRIRDNGPGIDKAIMARIFDPFFTTKARTHGTGIGLSISQSIIREMHGSITAANIQPQGAEFLIRLPRTEAAESSLRDPHAVHVAGGLEAGGNSKPASLTLPALRILLVDDETALRNLIAQHLSMVGPSVSEAKSGSEALQLLASGEFDLLITDHLMSQMTGLQLIETARQRFPRLPCILLTGGLMDDAQIRSLNIGFLEKPFGPADLVKVILEMGIKT